MLVLLVEEVLIMTACTFLFKSFKSILYFPNFKRVWIYNFSYLFFTLLSL